jgi:hypothetical protein
MDSGFPLDPSFTTTSPMTFTHFMGTNPFVFDNGMQNYDTMSMPWVSSHFSHGMSDMSSHLPPYVLPPYNPSPFGGSHVPQTTLTVGGWIFPFYEFTFLGAGAQMGGHYTYYTLPTYLSSTMSVLMDDFPMVDLCPSSSVWETPFKNFLCLGEKYILT